MVSSTPLHTGAEPSEPILHGQRHTPSDWRTESPRLTPSPFQSSHIPTQTMHDPACASSCRGDLYPTSECQDMIREMVIDALHGIIQLDRGNEPSYVTREWGNRRSFPESERASQRFLVSGSIDHQPSNNAISGGELVSSKSRGIFSLSSPRLSTSYPGKNNRPSGLSELPASQTSSNLINGANDMSPLARHSHIDVQSDGILSATPTVPPRLSYGLDSHHVELSATATPRLLPQSWMTFIKQDEELSQRVQALRTTPNPAHSSTRMSSMTNPRQSDSFTSFDSVSLTMPSECQRPKDSLLLSVPESLIGSHPRRFRPMEAVIPQAQYYPHGSFASPDVQHKFSKRYRGGHTEKNASHDHLQDHENCALWLRNLPPNITYTELLDSIRGIGRIWATVINGPSARHDTAAAKVAFFTPEAAANFLAHIQSTKMKIRGFAVAVEYNRTKVPRQLSGGWQASRVLIITGQPTFVNEESLTRFFQGKLKFQTDRVIERFRVCTRVVIEFRFGSFRNQAQAAKMALEREQPRGLESVRFGQDPCGNIGIFPSYEAGAEGISRCHL